MTIGQLSSEHAANNSFDQSQDEVDFKEAIVMMVCFSKCLFF